MRRSHTIPSPLHCYSPIQMSQLMKFDNDMLFIRMTIQFGRLRATDFASKSKFVGT